MPSLLLVCLAACVAVLAVVVGSASAAKTHIFKEAFGSSAQPTFTAPSGMAIDQGTGDVYVVDAGSPPAVKRYNANGTPDGFSALSSNAIDAAGGDADATPQGSLSFGTANSVQIAIDESGTATDGDIYVAQAQTALVDVFDSTGTYKGQLTESSEGPLGEICGVAVDSAGALYLGDISGKVHKYVPAANPPVNGDNTANFATVAEPCQIAAGAGATAGFIFVNGSNGELLKVDASTGEVKYSLGSENRAVYVNPATGHVYASRNFFESSEVVEYDASGALSATTVSAFKPGSTIEGLAVRESSSDVYLTRAEHTQVQVYGPTVTQPDVTTTTPSSNTGTRAALAGTVNPDGVELTECFFEWSKSSGSFENTAPCAEANATIGSGTSPVVVHADVSGLAPQGARYKDRLVAKNAGNPAVTGSNVEFTTPNTVLTTAASGATPIEVTLNGTVNPDTTTISACVFEWGPAEAQGGEIQQPYPEAAPCAPGPGSITGTSPVAVHADLSGLQPGTEYAYRLRATYPTGPATGAEMTAQTLGPRIPASWSQDVVLTEATLKAEIDPEGSATTYRFEWGTTTNYGSSVEGAVGSDNSVHQVSAFLTSLQPGTIYHYRVVAGSSVATAEGPDRTFTTSEPIAPETGCANQTNRYGPGANLPDCRAYEMVSPVDKNGGEIRSLASGNNGGVNNSRRAEMNQASIDGDAITFSSFKAFAGASGATYSNQYIARRSPGGWLTESITPLQSNVDVLHFNGSLVPDVQFKGFSEDLSQSWFTQKSRFPLTPEALGEEAPNLYGRDDKTGALHALTIGETTNITGIMPLLEGHTSDNSHVIFGFAGKLTPDAINNHEQQLYDYSNGNLQLVSVLPNGEASSGKSRAGGGPPQNSQHGAMQLEHAISADGTRIFWSSSSAEDVEPVRGTLYVRIDGTHTVQVSEGAEANFWRADANGSTVIYGEPASGGSTRFNEDLFAFDVDAESRSLIAGKVLGVVGGSDDLSRLYFVSTEALAPGATAGDRNLYLDEEGAVTLIAPLSTVDTGEVIGGSGGDKAGNSGVQLHQPGDRASRVSVDGRHLLFMSNRNLTGYDNTDAVTGEPDLEVYLYAADTDRLICISCNPTGGRPVGQPYERPYATTPLTNFSNTEIGAAAWIPTWENSLHASRLLSTHGDRVFFDSFDPLVQQDTNGKEDVYQWEAPGTGSCAVGASGYSPVDEGCVSLISTGGSSQASEFIDADPSGETVFFRTASSIDPRDPGLLDIYAARVGGGYPPPVAQPSPCVGDSCQSPPAPPESPSPASASFEGTGNPQPGPSCGRPAKRATRLSHLARRLRRAAKRAPSPGKARRLHRRAVRAAKRARPLNVNAKRCRHAVGRATR